MNNMGYFKYSDTFVFGSVLFPKIECMMEYSEAYEKALDNSNIIIDANIGHVQPKFTILNGSYATIKYKDNEIILKQEILNENNG